MTITVYILIQLDLCCAVNGDDLSLITSNNNNCDYNAQEKILKAMNEVNSLS